VNINDEPVTASLTLYSTSGTVLTTRDLPLEGRALVRQTLTGIFGELDFATASHVKVKSDRPLLGYEILANFKVSATSTVLRETVAASSRQVTDDRVAVLPQFVTGGGWLSFLGLVNTSALPQEVSLTAFMEDGTPWDVLQNPKRVVLEGNGALRSTVEELFGFPTSELRTGWIELRSSLGFLSSFIAFGNTQTPSFAMVSGVEENRASRFQVYSNVNEGDGSFTGLTVVNPGGQTASLELFVLKADGSTIGRATFSLAPNQRVEKLLRELLPASLDVTGGWAFLRSSVPVLGAALFGPTNGFALANVPLQIPAGDFLPPAQLTASISGTVVQGGVGVSGVSVTLSGPVNSTKSTNVQGQFVFGTLPAGTYKLVVSKTGAEFSPVERSVQLELENVTRQDFQGGGLVPAELPAIAFISLSSTFSGNTTLSVTVVGTDFNPTSRVEFNGTPLQTTFINSAELRAVITPELLAGSGSVTVGVVTPPPGGGTSVAATFTVNPIPDNPLIEGRINVGSFPAGVAIHPTRRIVLVTNEASDNVSVIDLDELIVTDVIGVGRSPSEGIAIHPGKELAVVANVGSNDVSVIDLTTMQVTSTIGVGRFPIGVGIDTTRHQAVVSNGEDATVSIIDLDSLTVVNTIQVGPRPGGVAVNSTTGIAVVANRGQNTVSVIDLEAGTSVATIGIEGDFPRGVAINEKSNVAIVTNANSNTVSIIDLQSNRLLDTVAVGSAPTGVAVHELTNHAVITNSAVTRGSAQLGALTTAAILDLAGQIVVESVPVGSAAFGVDVDETSQIAVVANFGSHDVPIVRISNPTPRVGDIEPRTFPAGGGEFTVTIRGTGFLPTSVVTLNGDTLPTTFVSSTELQAVVSAELLDQLFQVRGITLDSADSHRFNQVTNPEFNIGVSNPGPGGGNSPPPANPATNHLVPSNAVPILLNMFPTEIETGASELVLTLNGNNFNATTVVEFGNAPHSPLLSTETSMRVVIPGSDLPPGIFDVSVINPPPGGGTTASLPFTVLEFTNPTPAISSVTPSSVPIESAATGLVISGSGFFDQTSVSLNGQDLPVNAIDSSSLELTLPAPLLVTPRTLAGLVANPRFPVFHQAPVLRRSQLLSF
jgi:YVTN family beta-propeller protein